MPFINEAVWALHDGVAEAGGDRHDREARLRAPDGAARARRPDRPRHVRRDHGSAARRARRRPLRALPAAPRAGECRANWAASLARGFYIYPGRQDPTGPVRQNPRRRSTLCASCWSTTTTRCARCCARPSRPSTSRSTRPPTPSRPRQRIAAARPDAIVLDVAHAGPRRRGALRAAEGGAARRARSRSCC